MKERRGAGGDRFAVFPFSIGCMSQSSVAVADPNEKKTQSDPSSSTTATATTTAAQSSEEGGGDATKEKPTATPASPGIVTSGVQKLMKGIKQSLSQMFTAYDGEDDDDDEEQEMVIGYPTDVQHVGHIGWDGHGGLNNLSAMGMVNAFSLPSSLSLRQLEVAMDQAAHA